MSTLYCGLDVGSSVCYLVAKTQTGVTKATKQFGTSEQNLVSEFESLGQSLHVHLESTELAAWIRTILLDRVPRVKKVVVSHPKTNSWIAKDALKSDERDAGKLADLLRLDILHEVYYPDCKDLLLFKRTVQHYEQLTEQTSALKQRIKSRLLLEGIHATGTAPYGEEGRRLALEAVEDPARRQAIRHLYDLLDSTEQIRSKALKLMRAQSSNYPVIERLQAVPGIGLKLACRFVAYIQNPHRFSTVKKLWRYCKLGITERSSDGKPLGHKRLDYNGVGKLKDLSFKAYASAVSTKKSNKFQRAYRSTFKKTKDKTHARLTVQRKILAVMWAMWRDGTEYDDQMG